MPTNIQWITSSNEIWVVEFISPVALHLISEKSIWKNQVRQTGYLVYFELDFYCLTACVAWENQFRN